MSSPAPSSPSMASRGTIDPGRRRPAMEPIAPQSQAVERARPRRQAGRTPTGPARASSGRRRRAAGSTTRSCRPRRRGGHPTLAGVEADRPPPETRRRALRRPEMAARPRFGEGQGGQVLPGADGLANRVGPVVLDQRPWRRSASARPWRSSRIPRRARPTTSAAWRRPCPPPPRSAETVKPSAPDAARASIPRRGNSPERSTSTAAGAMTSSITCCRLVWYPVISVISLTIDEGGRNVVAGQKDTDRADPVVTWDPGDSRGACAAREDMKR